MKFLLKLIPYTLLLLFTANEVIAQPKRTQKSTEERNADKFYQQVELGKEYFAREEYEKVVSTYEKLLKENFELYAGTIHEIYLKALTALRQTKAIEKYLLKMGKTFPYQNYKVDLAMFYSLQKEDKKADKVIERLADDLRNSPMEVEVYVQQFIDSEKYDWAELLIATSRKALGDPNAYMREASEIYRVRGRTDEMLLELLTWLDKQYGNLYSVQMILQQNLTSEEDYLALERLLLKKIQTEPDKIHLNELLYWLYVQRKDFTGALQQAKALDKRNKNSNSAKVQELAYLARSNKSYDAALDAFLYLSANAGNEAIKSAAVVRALEIKEILVKNTIPLDVQKVRNLIKDYQEYIAKNDALTGQANQINPNNLEAYRSIGLLYAWYLSNPDSAIIFLEKVATAQRGDRNLIDKAKLELGDVYVLQEIFWEATLLYSQVEKTQKETVLGHEAKLRNARLSFYKGEFVLASEHLDVLKAATTREISNDAMDLGLLIQDNTVFDTSGADLKQFARIELLRFQHRYTEALSALKTLESSTSEAGLKDEILWSRMQIYNALQQYDSSLAVIETIVRTYPDGLYADDALFEKGRILSEEKMQKEAAMAVYEQLISSYPGSIYVVESRKRYRNLRGDKLN